MNKLLTLAALTLLTATSTAWASSNDEDSYSGPHVTSVPAHPIEMVNNELDGGKLLPISTAHLNSEHHMMMDSSHTGTE